MSDEVEKRLLKIPVINIIVRLLKNIKLPSFKGLSVYDLLEMYTIGIIKGALTSRAGAIAFSFFMAIFPTLLFLLNLLPYIPIDNFQQDFMANIMSLLPPETNVFFEGIIEDIVKQRRGGLLSSTFLLSIFLMANGVNAIFGGFEYSYHIEETRNFFRQYLYALGVGLILALLLIFTVAVLIYFEILIGSLQNSGYLNNNELWYTLAKNVFFLTMIYFIIAILYYFGTTGTHKVRFFSPGALMTTILILLTTYLFRIYITNFSQYNELYGSIGALLILMLYIWLNANILLLGFELNASLNSLKLKNSVLPDDVLPNENDSVH